MPELETGIGSQCGGEDARGIPKGPPTALGEIPAGVLVLDWSPAPELSAKRAPTTTTAAAAARKA